MSNASLLTLPVELLHRIFDHLGVQTILRAIRCVCKQFYATVNTYNRFKLNFTTISKSHIELISHLIPPESIISLTFFDDDSKKTSGQISLFFSIFEIHRFTRLRSLTLLQIGDVELYQFLQHFTTYSLISLSVQSRERESSRTLDILSTAIAKSSLQKLHLTNFDYIIKHISWPIQYTLQHLKIRTCTYDEYHIILSHSPHLRTFVMRDCTMNYANETVLSSSTRACYSQLTSLTISDSQLPTKDLKSLISLTSSLVYLKLVSSRSAFDSVFDASFWEEFIRTKLPLLKKFEFFFAYKLLRNVSLDSLIAPFRAPFWLDDKLWFVTCDYVIKSSQIRLYTTPACMADCIISIRCALSSTDHVYRLTKRLAHEVIDATTEEAITTLDLWDNSIGAEETEQLADILRNTHTLTTLNLARNNIGEQGAQHLADVLRNNHTLTTLNLAQNSIGNQGAEYLADALRNNQTLATLHLWKNRIDTQGRLRVIETLKDNTRLKVSW